MTRAKEIVDYWLDEVGPEGWYAGGEALDSQIRDRFMDDWSEAATGALGLWLTDANSVLGYLILTTSIPRNMFRGDPRSFALDRSARAAAKGAIAKDWDLSVPEPARQFFYLPLMHSENLVDQDRSVAAFQSRMPETGADNLIPAMAHRLVIRRFGRFPYRNAALGRRSTPAEIAFLEGGAYGSAVREIQEKAGQ